MGISFEAGDERYEIGSSSFLNAFTSTIGYHLENNELGSKYPLMKELLEGNLTWQDAEEAEKEALQIQKELTKFSPDKIIWDCNDLSKRPPWGDNSSHITSLANYFVTSDGKDLFEVIFKVLNDSKRDEVDIEIN